MQGSRSMPGRPCGETLRTEPALRGGGFVAGLVGKPHSRASGQGLLIKFRLPAQLKYKF